MSGSEFSLGHQITLSIYNNVAKFLKYTYVLSNRNLEQFQVVELQDLVGQCR